MHDYTTVPGLENVHLEDSWVLDITSDPIGVTFVVEFVLTEGHPEHKQPLADEQYCYRRGTLSFRGVTESRWRRPMGFSPHVDPSGELDYGNIDSLRVHDGDYVLEGDWGEMQVTAASVSAHLDVTD